MVLNSRKLRRKYIKCSKQLSVKFRMQNIDFWVFSSIQRGKLRLKIVSAQPVPAQVTHTFVKPSAETDEV